MPMDDGPTTSTTLLRNVAQSAGAVRGDEFARLYEPLLKRFVGREHYNHQPIPQDQRDDLVQEAYIAILKALPRFRYDPAKGRFRGYLSRLVHHIVVRHCATEGRRDRKRDEQGEERLNAVPAETDPQRMALEDADNADLMGRIWTMALDRVFQKNLFAPNTRAVFFRYVVEGIPVETVAREFKMAPNAIYQIKNRILKAVRKELAALPPVPGFTGLEAMHEALLRQGGHAPSETEP